MVTKFNLSNEPYIIKISNVHLYRFDEKGIKTLIWPTTNITNYTKQIQLNNTERNINESNK